MNDKMLEALNRQINMELFAEYQYLAMAAYFDSVSMRGFEQWMRAQSAEENVHAMKFFNFVLERGHVPTLHEIAAPKMEFSSPLEAFEAALAHEQKVTRSINELYDLARELGDYPAQVLLQWFINEQVEEEASVGEVVERIRFAGDHPAALLMLDGEVMSSRGSHEMPDGATAH